eukprot:173887_1
MAETARTKEEEKEYFDSQKVLNAKVSQLAKLIENCNHFVAFTGAGISTSCGISDFRSGVDTVNEVGAGVWAKEAAQKNGIQVNKPKKQVKMLSALPSITHMALVQLCNENILKCIISQNVDGLHRRSGIPSDKLCELHGNTNLERCNKCKHYYLRDYHVRTSWVIDEHKTGRKCIINNCNGDLLDTIVNFGESLPMNEFNKAQKHTKIGDICFAFGSSLTVTPAADFAKEFGKNKQKHLCIVNLQKTVLDDLCTIRIFAKCDHVMKLLMNKLQKHIPQWKLVRYIDITCSFGKHNGKMKTFEVNAIEQDGTPASLFKSVVLRVCGKQYFIGDPKWRDSENIEIAKKQQIELLENTLKLLNKHLKKYTIMIYNAGFHTVDSLSGFNMDIACDVMIGSNNYERRLIVDRFYKSILELAVGHDLKQNAKFKDIEFNGIDDEKGDNNNNEFSLEFEFAKHYDE